MAISPDAMTAALRGRRSLFSGTICWFSEWPDPTTSANWNRTAGAMGCGFHSASAWDRAAPQPSYPASYYRLAQAKPHSEERQLCVM